MDAPVFLLALAFGIHIVMVNLGIGLATLVPYLRWRAGKTGDEGLDSIAKELMRFYAATYAVAGVFGTAFTVFLLSFYPTFIGLAGHLTMIPFGFAIVLIAFHFFTISAYWYGWDRWSRSTHNLIGWLMAISVLLIPLFFRTVFAFLNTGDGLAFDAVAGKPYIDIPAALANGTLLPLYLKSITAAYTATMLALAGAYAYRYLHTSDEEKKRLSKIVIEQGVKWALVGLILLVIFGFWYALSLRTVEYKFNNIFGGLGWKVGDGTVAANYSWLFILKMILVIIQFYVAIVAYNTVKSGAFQPEKLRLLIYGGAAALFTIVFGEYLNAFSQYPYFVADVPNPNHQLASTLQQIGQASPTLLQEIVYAVDMKTSVNELATLTGVMAITAAFLAFLLLAAAYFLYKLLLGEEKA